MFAQIVMFDDRHRSLLITEAAYVARTHTVLEVLPMAAMLVAIVEKKKICTYCYFVTKVMCTQFVQKDQHLNLTEAHKGHDKIKHNTTTSNVKILSNSNKSMSTEKRHCH